MAVRIERQAVADALSSVTAGNILDTRTRSSVVLSTFPQFQMAANVYTQPMFTGKLSAKWVTEDLDDSGIKPTSNFATKAKSMTTAELAVIVPVHDNLIADVSNWGAFETYMREKVTEAFAVKIDDAVLWGQNAPAQWTDLTGGGLVGRAVTAGNRVQNPATGTKADLLEQFNQLFARVEEDRYSVTDVLAVNALRYRLRGLRDATGNLLYSNDAKTDGATGSVYGYPLSFIDPEAARPAEALAIALDRSQFQVGIRQDVTVSASNQASLTGIGNLWERDMTAFRFVFRLGFGSLVQDPEVAGAYPVAVLAPDATA